MWKVLLNTKNSFYIVKWLEIYKQICFMIEWQSKLLVYVLRTIYS